VCNARDWSPSWSGSSEPHRHRPSVGVPEGHHRGPGADVTPRVLAITARAYAGESPPGAQLPGLLVRHRSETTRPAKTPSVFVLDLEVSRHE
jgi:hypothetical protein